ncbi:hypothetical protein JCM10908_002699 [Rhodotorula pacifica]|uniref:uncharacterized protein n=1 Tax=Rhodotorula pacifica TaxID=1495444 RepID=UPI00317F0513
MATSVETPLRHLIRDNSRLATPLNSARELYAQCNATLAWTAFEDYIAACLIGVEYQPGVALALPARGTDDYISVLRDDEKGKPVKHLVGLLAALIENLEAGMARDPTGHSWHHLAMTELYRHRPTSTYPVAHALTGPMADTPAQPPLEVQLEILLSKESRVWRSFKNTREACEERGAGLAWSRVEEMLLWCFQQRNIHKVLSTGRNSIADLIKLATEASDAVEDADVRRIETATDVINRFAALPSTLQRMQAAVAAYASWYLGIYGQGQSSIAPETAYPHPDAALVMLDKLALSAARTTFADASLQQQQQYLQHTQNPHPQHPFSATAAPPPPQLPPLRHILADPTYDPGHLRAAPPAPNTMRTDPFLQHPQGFWRSLGQARSGSGRAGRAAAFVPVRRWE